LVHQKIKILMGLPEESKLSPTLFGNNRSKGKTS